MSNYNDYTNLLQNTNFIGGAGQDALPSTLDSRTTVSQDQRGQIKLK